jgi:hypothetical protein
MGGCVCFAAMLLIAALVLLSAAADAAKWFTREIGFPDVCKVPKTLVSA